MDNIMKKAIIFGVFDTLHAGHMYYIDRASKEAESLDCVLLEYQPIFTKIGEYAPNYDSPLKDDLKTRHIKLQKFINKNKYNIKIVGPFLRPYDYYGTEEHEALILGGDLTRVIAISIMNKLNDVRQSKGLKRIPLMFTPILMNDNNEFDYKVSSGLIRKGNAQPMSLDSSNIRVDTIHRRKRILIEREHYKTRYNTKLIFLGE